MSSLCFYDAALKRSKKEIEEEVYLEMLASHCRGERHGINKQCDGDSKHDGKEILDYMARLRGLDDTAYTFQYWILDQEPVKESGPLIKVFETYRARDGAKFTAALDAMRKEYGSKHPRFQSSLCEDLSSSAMRQKDLHMLRLVMPRSVHHHFDFDAQYDTMKHKGTDPEIVEYIDGTGFKSMVPRGKRFSDMHPLDYL